MMTDHILLASSPGAALRYVDACAIFFIIVITGVGALGAFLHTHPVTGTLLGSLSFLVGGLSAFAFLKAEVFGFWCAGPLAAGVFALIVRWHNRIR